MALTSGTWNITGSVGISGATIAPQGDAPTTTLNSPEDSQTEQSSLSIAFGTSTGECDLYCAGQWQLAAAATTTFDLFGGTLKDLFGGTANFQNLKSIYVSIESGGDAAGLTIGGAASNATQLWFDAQDNKWTIYPDGAPFLGGSAAGVTIDATNRNLLVENNGAVDVVFNLFLAGVSV